MSPSRRPSFDHMLEKLTQHITPLRHFKVHDPGVGRFQPEMLEEFVVLRKMIDAYFQVEFEGTFNIPSQGGALLVGNHGRTGLDAFIFTGVAPVKLGRPVRALADRALFRVPGFRDWIAACGAVPGTRENAVSLLKAGNLVVVYPGGNREVMKTARQAYQLLWGDRVGFVKVAIESGVPIVPFAGLGVEELYHDVAWWETFEQSWVAKVVNAMVGRVPLAPITGLGPLPVPEKLTFRFGEALPTSTLDPEDHNELLRFQRQVRDRIHAMLRPDEPQSRTA